MGFNVPGRIKSSHRARAPRLKQLRQRGREVGLGFDRPEIHELLLRYCSKTQGGAGRERYLLQPPTRDVRRDLLPRSRPVI